MNFWIEKKNILVFGYGGVSACFIDLLIRHYRWPPASFVVVDKEDKTKELEGYLSQGLRFHQATLCQGNIQELVTRHAKPGDLILDLTVNVDTVEFLSVCQHLGLHYMNAALEQWSYLSSDKDLANQTLYARHRELNNVQFNSNGPTAILDCGANPGLVSHFTKAALWALGEEKGRIPGDKPFASLAQDLGVKTIHISEWDQQTGSLNREPGEFANTWSVDGLLEESLAPAEMGWGTHEETLPPDGKSHPEGPQNQIYLTQAGCQTKVLSWVPSGPIEGYVIRHGEAFTLSRFLTVKAQEKVVYRPTVHYAYRLSEGAQASLEEWKASDFQPPPKKTILTHQLIQGRDELGVLLLGDFGARWYGSLLDLREANTLLPGHNATTLQVAAGLLGGLEAILREPQRGVLVPEDLDHVRALEVAAPFLGPVVYKKSDWNPGLKPGQKDLWQFQNLRIT